ncbi:MAG: PASTA domain-containing protein [Acidobacteria bacterium]|nr:PASTA domain-containing protein [Acidobacteriota bacterium]
MPTPTTPPTLGTRVWTAGRWMLLLAGLGATYLVFMLTSMRVAIKAREVTVPDLVGQSLAAATDAAAATGVTMVVDPLKRPDGTVPPDHVISQEPAAGTVIRRQRPIRVRLSEALRAAVVPQVTGESERTAQIRLAQERVTVTQMAEIFSTAYSPGVIVAQDPPATSQSAQVALLINRGEAAMTYVMPDLIGTSGTRVADLLRRRLFRVTILGEVPYPGLPAGTVVRQTPQAGFQIAPGDPITLEVSR